MLEPEPFLAWVQHKLGASFDPQKSMHHLEWYLRISLALSSWVSDSSIASIYAHNSRASFYTDIIKANPFVLDALLACSDGQLRVFETVMRWLLHMRSTYSVDGGLSRLIVPIDRAAMMLYLTEHSDPVVRRSLAKLIQGI